MFRRYMTAALILICGMIFFTAAGPGTQAADKQAQQEHKKSPDKPEKVIWLTYDRALQKAKQDKLPLVLVFYSDNCRKCEILEKNGFNRPDTAGYVNAKFAPVRINGPKNLKLKNKYNVNVYPTVWFLTSDAKQFNAIIGYVEPDKLALILRYIGDGQYKSKSWKKFEKEQKK